MRIAPDGIGEVMECMKQNYKATNKAILKQVILLMGALAEAVGQPIIKYNNKCFKPLLVFLGDKAALMRADVIATADKWSDAIGPEFVINSMCTYLETGNPVMRTDILKWIVAHKSAIIKCEHPLMIKPFLACLTDKTPEIRGLADEVIVATMSIVGFGPFSEGIKDMKPAVQGTVRPLLEKAKQKAITANPSAAMAEPEEDVKGPSATKKPIKGGAAASKTTKTAVGSRATLGKSAVSKSGEDDDSPAKAAKPATLTRKPVGSRPGPTLKAAAAEEEPFSVNPGNKERRAQLDSNSKWVHDDVKPVHLTAVKK